MVPAAAGARLCPGSRTVTVDGVSCLVSVRTVRVRCTVRMPPGSQEEFPGAEAIGADGAAGAAPRRSSIGAGLPAGTDGCRVAVPGVTVPLSCMGAPTGDAPRANAVEGTAGAGCTVRVGAAPGIVRFTETAVPAAKLVTTGGFPAAGTIGARTNALG